MGNTSALSDFLFTYQKPGSKEVSKEDLPGNRQNMLYTR